MTIRLSGNPATTPIALAVPVFSLVLSGTALFTKQRKVFPDDGVITRSILIVVATDALLCFVEKLTDLAGSICRD